MAAIVDALGLPAERDPWHGIEAALRPAPALLVLDNLETPWEHHPTDVEDLLSRLARVPGVALAASIRGGAVAGTAGLGDAPGGAPSGLRRTTATCCSPLPATCRRTIRSCPTRLRALDGWPLAIELFAAQAGGFGGLALTWRRWQSERTAMLDRGEADADRLSSLAVSLGFSLGSPRMKLKPAPPDGCAGPALRHAGPPAGRHGERRRGSPAPRRRQLLRPIA